MAIKFLEENVGEYLCDLWLGKNSLDAILKKYYFMDKLDFVSTKNLCTLKALLRRWRYSSETGRQYLSNVYFIKESYLVYIKNTNPIRKWTIQLKMGRRFEWICHHWRYTGKYACKTRLTLKFIREMHKETTVSYHYILIINGFN